MWWGLYKLVNFYSGLSIWFALGCNNIFSAYEFQRSDQLMSGTSHTSKKPLSIKGLGIPLLIGRGVYVVSSSSDKNNEI